MMTKEEAKLYLAEHLPERIELFDATNKDNYLFRWKDKTDTCFCLVVETEWQQIALWVEEKMTDEQFIKYRDCLIAMIPQSQSENEQGRFVLSSNYTTRATAMKESGL